MSSKLSNLFSDERGATAIEYAFVASLVSIAAFVAFGTIGTSLSGIFNNVAAKW
jgi:pilus assembly protein Flp/PilA